MHPKIRAAMMGPDYDKVAFDLKVVRSWHEWTGDMIKSSRKTILMRHVWPSQRVLIGDPCWSQRHKTLAFAAFVFPFISLIKLPVSVKIT